MQHEHCRSAGANTLAPAAELPGRADVLCRNRRLRARGDCCHTRMHQHHQHRHARPRPDRVPHSRDTRRCAAATASPATWCSGTRIRTSISQHCTTSHHRGRAHPSLHELHPTDLCDRASCRPQRHNDITLQSLCRPGADGHRRQRDVRRRFGVLCACRRPALSIASGLSIHARHRDADRHWHHSAVSREPQLHHLRRGPPHAVLQPIHHLASASEIADQLPHLGALLRAGRGTETHTP